LEDQGGGIDILLVERDPLNVLKIRKYLSNEEGHYVIHHVIDGVRALDFLNKAEPYVDVPRPDLIILNVDLPKLDGYQVLENLKQQRNLHGVQVIIVSDDQRTRGHHQKLNLPDNFFEGPGVKPQDFLPVIKAVENFLLGSLKGNPYHSREL